MTVKKVLILYCIAMLVIFTFVPWNGVVRSKSGKSTSTRMRVIGYSFITAPPNDAVSVNYKQVFFEWIGITTVGGIAYIYAKKLKDKDA